MPKNYIVDPGVAQTITLLGEPEQALRFLASSKIREERSFYASLEVLKLCRTTLFQSNGKLKRRELSESLVKTFDAEHVPNELIRGSLASLFCRFTPEIVFDHIERFNLTESAIVRFTVERFAWIAPRSLALHFNRVINSFVTSGVDRADIAGIIAQRDPLNTIELVASLNLPRTDLVSVLKKYIYLDPSLVPAHLRAIEIENGELSDTEKHELARLTIERGGESTFLYYINTFFPHDNKYSDRAVVELINTALASHKGASFFFDNEQHSRMSPELIRYIYRTFHVDHENRTVLKY